MHKRGHIKGLFAILRHPIEGFEQLRYYANGSMAIATALYGLFFAAIVSERQFTGYLFNSARVEKLNILIMLAMSLGMLALWVIANMAVCTLTDGEGALSDIYVATAYALLPYVLAAPVYILLSNVLIQKEIAYLQVIQFVRIAWSFLLLMCGNLVAHQFTVKKTIGTALLTVCGMAIMLFLIFLTYSLVQQLLEFIKTIINEITFMQ